MFEDHRNVEFKQSRMQGTKRLKEF